VYDEKGKAEIEILFYSMDRDEDAGNIDSLELTGAYINEARGLPGEKQSIILNTVNERCGRFPAISSLMNPDSLKKKIILDSNPPSTSHWLYNTFEVERPEQFEIFNQPSGLIKLESGKYITNPEAENISHLSKDYYVESAYGKTEEHIRVQLMGHYGSFTEGERVYKAYNDDIHSVDTIEFIPGVEVIIGFDFGCTPHAVFMQLSPLGILQITKELYDDNSDLETFAKNIVRPYIDRILPPHLYEEITVVGDPAGVARGHDNRTAFTVLSNALARKAIPAKSNTPTTRVGAVNYFLGRLVGGKPAFIVSRKGCPRLRDGFNGGYQLRLMSGEKIPLKNIYSHGQDATQYGCLYVRPDEAAPTKKSFQPSMVSKGNLF
jgi:hypothetical protein